MDIKEETVNHYHHNVDFKAPDLNIVESNENNIIENSESNDGEGKKIINHFLSNLM